MKPALKSLTAIAALPQAGGCMANLPAEMGKASQPTLGACIANLEAQQPEPLTYPPIDLGLVEGCK